MRVGGRRGGVREGNCERGRVREGKGERGRRGRVRERGWRRGRMRVGGRRGRGRWEEGGEMVESEEEVRREGKTQEKEGVAMMGIYMYM